MNFRNALIGQFHHHHDLFGRLAGRIMAKRSLNWAQSLERRSACSRARLSDGLAASCQIPGFRRNRP